MPAPRIDASLGAEWRGGQGTGKDQRAFQWEEGPTKAGPGRAAFPLRLQLKREDGQPPCLFLMV